MSGERLRNEADGAISPPCAKASEGGQSQGEEAARLDASWLHAVGRTVGRWRLCDLVDNRVVVVAVLSTMKSVVLAGATAPKRSHQLREKTGGGATTCGGCSL